MRYKNIFLGILACLWFSCNSNKDDFNSYRLNEVNTSYLKEIKVFKNDLVDHFPKEINSLPTMLYYRNDSTEPFRYVYLFEFNVGKEIIDSIKSFAEKNKVSFDIEKDSIINTERLHKHLTLNNTTKEKKLSVVPYFENVYLDYKDEIFKRDELFNLNNIDGLSNEFETYILGTEYKTSIQMPINNLTEFKDSGHSKGIMINGEKNIIIFWAIYW